MALLGVIRSRPFLAGLACGVVVTMLTRLIINETSLADYLVAPLLVNDSPANADAIVVLGAGIVGDCVPNLNAVRRVMRASRLFRQRRAPFLAITGGSGDVGCHVGDAMAQLAIEFGVPAEKIRVERSSYSTYENAQFVAPVLRAEGVRRVLLVTDRMHMLRAQGVFAHFGFRVEPAPVPIYEGHENNVAMLFAGVREALAITYYRLRGWMAADASLPRDASAVPNLPMNPIALSNPDGPLVILGASYAKNWNLAPLDDTAVVNVGIAGEKSFEMQARFDQDVVARRPRAVILWGFINDLFATEDLDAASARVRTTFDDMIARARAAGIEPIAATEITVRVNNGMIDRARGLVGRLLGKQSNQERINQRVMALNDWLRDACRQQNVLVLELSRALADQSGHRRPEFAAADGSHVTQAGYDALTAYARPILLHHLQTQRK